MGTPGKELAGGSLQLPNVRHGENRLFICQFCVFSRDSQKLTEKKKNEGETSHEERWGVTISQIRWGNVGPLRGLILTGDRPYGIPLST